MYVGPCKDGSMDRVVFINRGKDGKELQLYKYLKGRHVSELFTEDELKPYGVSTGESVAINLSFRLMAPDEALEISRCIYRAYKYTYLAEPEDEPEVRLCRDGAAARLRGAGWVSLLPNR